MSLVIAIFLASHLMCMQLAAMGPLMCIWADVCAARSKLPLAVAARRRLAGACLWSFVLGIGLGFVLAGCHTMFGDRDYLRGVSAVYGRTWWGVWELGFYFGCMFAYWWIGRRDRPLRFWGRFGHGLLAVMAATNLLYHFPPLMAMISRYSRAAEAIPELSREQFRELLFSPLLVAKTAHFAFASLAVASIWLLVVLWGRPAEVSKSTNALDRTPWFAVVAIVGQLLTGIWLVTLLPPGQQRQMMGGNAVGTAALVGGIVMSITLLNQLSNLAFGDAGRRSVAIAASMLVVTIVLMSCVIVFR
ncbi:MAG: hypothetical protein R3E01_28055 [Pirellulaceae bacterium]|nr:hypothetical protein [Planctomycetales bacterium]